MSEEFDKEAEREKLREKYGDEAEDRQTTRQMSELLLKGATMTNAHCDTCGDPIFRYDGQEFCPTCQGQDSTHGTADADRDDPTDAATEPDQGAEPVAVETPDDAGTTDADTTDGSRPAGDGHDHDHDHGRDHTPAQSRSQSQSGSQPQSTGATAGDRTLAATPAETGGEVAEARQSLERTLARFARAAAATDDPRVARDHLAAAREAAEALSALRR